MKIHHIGYCVRDLKRSITEFEKLGFSVSGDTTVDQSRQVIIQFMKMDASLIELISPVSKNSPVSQLLNKGGEMPYHLCYQVDDIDAAIEQLVNDRYKIVQPPASAVVLQEKKVAFLFKNGVGVIELLQQ